MRILLRIMGAAAPLLISTSVGAAASASFGNTVRLEVPITCKLVHRRSFVRQGESYSLGQLLEYCNSPAGFLVEVQYQPGNLRGAIVQVGENRVILDGSGQSQVMSASGPKISTVNVTAVAGPSELDGSALQFAIVPL